MRKRPRGAILVFLLTSCAAALPAIAQTSAPQQQVTVTVVNALPQPPQPVRAVAVIVMSQDVSEARGVTNADGRAQLGIPAHAVEQGGLRIALDGAGNLVIYQPADGQLPGLTATLTISLLPKGSAALLGPAQIQAMLQQMSLEISSLKKNGAQQSSTAQQQKADFGAAIADWALADGFSEQEVNQRVTQWAEGIEKASGEATKEQKALAELALRRYAQAAQLFNDAGDADKQQLSAEDAQEQSLEKQAKALQAAQQAVLDSARGALRQMLDHAQQAAGADQLNLQFHQATQTLQSAEATAQAEYKKHPGDAGFHALWLQALRASTNALESEGEISSAGQSLPFLAESVNNDELLAQEYAAMADRAETATAQNDLGIALTEEGLRASPDQAIALFDRAVHAFQSALDFQTKADFPKIWAATQMNLGDVLKDEGERVAGDKAAVLLNQAVEAYRNALQVYTKSDTANNWAITQNNLGNALQDEGERAAGDNALALLSQAVQAFESALEVYTKDELPRPRAGTEANLGNALTAEGTRTSGEKGIALMDEAVRAYRSALEVFTKTDVPQEWARVQNGLGSALLQEGRRVSANKAGALFEQAVKAFDSALEVRTKADLPQDWATTESDLGVALFLEGEHANGDQAKSLFNQSVQAYRSALEVRTRAGLPQDWAATQSNLGLVLIDEAQISAGGAAAALLDQAAQAFSSALEVFTKADLPQAWAATQNNLGMALMSEAAHTSGDKTAVLFDQAVAAFQHALEVRTQANLPQDWAATQENLGNALMTEGEIMGGEKAAPLFSQAIQAYQSALEIYTKAGSPSMWVMTQMNLIEAEFTAGRSESCLHQAQALADGDLLRPLLPDRSVFVLACAWNAGDKSSALGAEKTLLAEVGLATAGAWDFTGVNHYISTAPSFATGRSSWIALFTAVQNGDSAGMTAALHQLEPIMQQ